MTNSPPESNSARATGTSSAPRVSVVMPVKDVADWISESVYSILSQTVSDLELIIVNDGSNDETLDLVRHIQRDDSRVRVLTNSGTGAAAARNTGVTVARGEYLAFADGDDIVPSRAYETMLASLDASGSEMVVGNYVVLQPQQTYSRRSSLPVYATRRSAVSLRDAPTLLRDRVCWNRLISRKAWNEAGIRFVDSSRSNDIVAMVQAYCAFSFDIIPDVVYGYRRRVGSTSISASRLDPAATIAHFTQELLCIDALERLGDDDVLRVFFIGILEHDIWAHASYIARTPVRSGPDLSAQRELFWEVVSHAPPKALEEIREWQRLIYSFVRAREWDFAAAASVGDDTQAIAAALETSSLAELVKTAHRLTSGVNGALLAIFRAVAASVVSADRRGQLSDDDIIRIVTSLREAQKAGIPRNRLTPLETALVDTPPDSDAAILRAICAAERTGAPPARRTLRNRVAAVLRRARRTASRLRHRIRRHHP